MYIQVYITRNHRNISVLDTVFDLTKAILFPQPIEKPYEKQNENEANY